MSDPLDFLDGPQGPKETPAPTPEPIADAKPQPTLETQPTADPPPTDQPKPAPKEPGEWTVAMAMDERDKRIAIQKERDELAAWKAAQEKQPAQQIDPLTDPEGFARDFESKVEKAKQDILFDTTHRFAVRQHGEEVVKAAEQWLGTQCQSNPAYFQTVMRQPDPYEFVVKEYKRHQAFAELGDDDPKTWFEKQFEARIKERGYIAPERGPDGKFVAASPAPATPTPLPKPSLASAPAASGNAPKTPVGEGVAFNAAFRE